MSDVSVCVCVRVAGAGLPCVDGGSATAVYARLHANVTLLCGRTASAATVGDVDWLDYVYNSDEHPLVIYSSSVGTAVNPRHPHAHVRLYVESVPRQMVRYGMVNVDLYSAIITKVSNALNTLVSGEKLRFPALSKGLVVLLCTEVVRQGVPDHGVVHSKCSASILLKKMKSVRRIFR